MMNGLCYLYFDLSCLGEFLVTFFEFLIRDFSSTQHV